MGFISQTSLFDVGSPNNRIANVVCDNSVYEGSFVKMSSLGIAFNALADTIDNANVIGCVESKETSTLCTIRFLGLTNGDIFSDLDVTKDYYLSDTVAGGITTTPPVGTGKVVLYLGQAFSSSKFLIKRGIGMVRSWLHQQIYGFVLF